MIFVRFVHFFTFIFWYGTLLYFLIQAIVLFHAFPRQQFGEIQNHLFPTYYLIGYLCGAVLILTYLFLHPLKNYEGQDYVKITVLCLMLLFSLGQGLWIGPKVSQLRLDRQQAEQSNDQAKADGLSKEFGKAHGISSLFNLVVILSGTVYLVYWFREISP